MVMFIGAALLSARAPQRSKRIRKKTPTLKGKLKNRLNRWYRRRKMANHLLLSSIRWRGRTLSKRDEVRDEFCTRGKGKAKKEEEQRRTESPGVSSFHGKSRKKKCIKKIPEIFAGGRIQEGDRRS